MPIIPTDADTTPNYDPQDHADFHNILAEINNQLGNFTQSTAAPGAPTTGDLWLDTDASGSGTTPVVKRQGGSATDWSTQGTTEYTPPATTQIQVGARISDSMGGSGFSDIAITFPDAFAQVPLVIVGQGPVANNSHVGIVAKTVTTTGFTLGFNNFSASSSVTVVAHWMAIGEMP